MSVRLFIVDTNVLVAGVITANPDSPTVKILDAMLAGSLIYLLSADLIDEYRKVLWRPKIRGLHGLNEREIDHVLTEIAANAVWRDPPPDASHPPPDPQDAHLWALAASEPTAILVTGDRRLIENPRPRCSVISPATWAGQFQVC